MASGPASLTQLPRSNVSLPLGDINVVVVTDVHSWVAGHARHGEPFDADYGDVLSFFRRLQAHPTFVSENRDLFFVMNGDFVDGTGLSTVPPTYLTPILRQMPWDAVNIGNHELYHNETIQYLLESGFVRHWSGGYLTSNVLLASNGEPIGERYALLQGNNSRVLAFGFLYNFVYNCKMTIVERVQDVVQQDWFRKVLVGERYDAILVLAHMDCVDPLVSVILESIRSTVGSDMPVQFLTGHSHRRCFVATDPASSSMEAGRFLDTIGFVSFPKQRTLASGVASKSRAELFQHTFIEASKEGLSLALGLDNAEDLSTIEGAQLTSFIHSSQRKLHLNNRLGCSPMAFNLDTSLHDPSSLWGLYMNHVIPAELFQGSSSKLFLQRTGAFRYSLFEGEITVDDIIAVCPFDDAIYEVADGIQGATVLEILRQSSSTLDGTREPLPALAASPSLIERDAYYNVYVPDWNMPEMLDRISNITGKSYTPAKLAGVSTTKLWFDFVNHSWPTCEAATEFMYSTSFRAPSAAEEIQERLPAVMIAAAGVILLIVLLVVRTLTVATRTLESQSRLLPRFERQYGSL